MLLSTVSLAISSVLIKRFSAHEDPVTISAYQFILGGALMSIGALIAGGRVSLSDLRGVLVLTGEDAKVDPINLVITLVLVSLGIFILNYQKASKDALPYSTEQAPIESATARDESEITVEGEEQEKSATEQI